MLISVVALVLVSMLSLVLVFVFVLVFVLVVVSACGCSCHCLYVYDSIVCLCSMRCQFVLRLCWRDGLVAGFELVVVVCSQLLVILWYDMLIQLLFCGCMLHVYIYIYDIT